MKWWIKILDSLWFIIPVGLVSFSHVVAKEIKIKEVRVKVKTEELSQFITQRDVEDLIQKELGYALVGQKLIHNDLNKVENLLKRNKFVKNAEVLSDHSGKVVINIEQHVPIARVINQNHNHYLTETGDFMPLSHYYSPRVLVLLGNKIEEILSTDSTADAEQRKEFIDMINYIKSDEFLSAQIATVEVLSDKKMVIYPQVSDQTIMFGTCEQYVEKFEKLRIFYHQILPRKGWDYYKKVNLDFKGQIICE